MKSVRLGNFIEEHCEKNKKGEDIPVFSVTNTNGFCTEYFSKDVSSKDKSNYKIVHKGFFAYNPSRINVGSVDWLRNEEKVIVSPLYNVFSVSPELEKQYLYYFLKSERGKTLIKSKAEGSVRDNLKFSILADFPIPLPSIEEQQKFVAKLDKASKLILKYKRLLEYYDSLIKSRFIEMFGDPVKNSLGWEVRKLKETTDIITGNTPSRKDKENYGTFIEWIKTDNITDKTYITTAAEYLSEKGEMLGRTVEAGSILMACIAGSLRSIGRVALTDRKVSFNQQINAIVPKKYNSLFLYALFQNTQSYAQSTVNMALKGILSKGKLEELEYILPPIELQNNFATFVQQIDKSKFEIEKIVKMVYN